MQEPVFTLRASDPKAPKLLRKMVDARRADLLGAERTDEIKAELRDLSAIDLLADEMDEWRRIYGTGR